ncbi:R2-like ligand-binding oxidase [Effusibacillus lacus]|uniref:R2-like ligand binding oxidase n=1 Tax=Effusibacillus lacus TaxID=1348429 RepID=A0A292YK08_9BACL|nr:R2-like ligand-binding oxidase [Effusibacillus lacus]TCS72836.1 ribonucleoside-diphosphate reductase beta chain [Effusibacillus lacus]GAX89239.1 ribonucleotide-diphosphate reductase [Effusibacillus lacus]
MRTEMITTSSRGLRTDSLPYRLYEKAKRFGVWNPKDIDFSEDKVHWQQLTDEQREDTLRLIAQFQAGEEAVTLDLLPLIMVIAKEGRIEEEMFLTTFLFEEAKHTEFFRLLLNELGETGDLSVYHTPAYRKIFYEVLPESLGRLVHDQSPEAIAEASTVYNMFIEGVLAETGYWAFYEGVKKAGIMPGLLKGIGYLKTDESRHIGYGTFLLQRMICEHPHLYDLVAGTMEQLAPLSIALNQENMGGREASGFGVRAEDSVAYSMKQLQIRMEVLARAKGQTMEEIYKTSETLLGVL